MILIGSICFIAGAAVGYICRASFKLTPTQILNQLDRFDVAEISEIVGGMERKWGLTAGPSALPKQEAGNEK